MFYPKSKEEKLSPELFLNPSCEYRGTPFWAWNDRLDREELIRQIHIFKGMGFGGFHMHVRTGLNTDYLSDEYMEDIRLCIDEARKLGMQAYLYDEDRWPSGSCGGRVTAEHPEFARRSLMLTTVPYAPDRPHRALKPEPGRGQEAGRQDNGELLAVYDIFQDSSGSLLKTELLWRRDEAGSRPVDRIIRTKGAVPSDDEICRMLPPEKAPAGARRWYAYAERAADDPWFNNHSYVDTLNPEAVKHFIQLTHERYAEAIGDEFGKGTKTIFTDEPQFTPKEPLAFASEPRDVFFPWTEGLDQLYRETYGEDLWPLLPELVFEPGEAYEPSEEGEPAAASGGAAEPEGSSPAGGRRYARVRLRMQNLLTNRFVDSFCRQIGNWCEEHDLLLTGHVMGEPTLESQTQAVGDAMRTYEAFGIPGIDMLCDFHEYTTAKQTASRVRQLGKEGMLSELYGVTGWDYDFRGYKLQGDWQAALGVTLRVPHLSWLSMHGEAKRDYPACIGYQSPWYNKYSLIEDHFARVASAMTRGQAVVRVGVIHPIESFWLLWGPGDQTGAARARMEQQFASLAETLLLGTIDFDYLDEALLEKEASAETAEACTTHQLDALFRVGQMSYETVVVPPLLTIRKTTLTLLQQFRSMGGRVLWQGEKPRLVDGRDRFAASEDFELLEQVYGLAERTGTDAGSVLDALEPERFLNIRREDGTREDSLVYQLRRDGDGWWLFIAKGKNPVSPDVDPSPKLKISLKGCFKASLYDTQSGEIQDLPLKYEKGWSSFEKVWHSHDSLLLYLTEASAASADASAGAKASAEAALDGAVEPAASAPVEEAPAASAAPAETAPASPAGSAAPAEKDLFFGAVPVTLEEPNMLLLDLAEYAVEDGTDKELEWYSEEEVLRIDNIVRQQLEISLRRKEVAQPYTISEKSRPTAHGKESLPGDEKASEGNARDGRAHLRLHFHFFSVCRVTDAALAMEDADQTEIWLNGEVIKNHPEGWFVDRCIRKVKLPVIEPGENVIEVRVPIGPRTNLECYYLLGSFAVELLGTKKVLKAPVDRLGFGDICPQGLPFYTGNLLYHLRVRTDGDFTLRVPHYRGGLLEVLLDGKPAGEIVYSPYELYIPAAPGDHEVAVRLYGTRQNGFAQLHHTQGIYFYQSPNSWRSDGDLWTYEYQLKKAGILRSPELMGARFIREDGTTRRQKGAASTVREHS